MEDDINDNNGLSANDPYGAVRESEKQGIKPDLRNTSGSNFLRVAERDAANKTGKKEAVGGAIQKTAGAAVGMATGGKLGSAGGAMGGGSGLFSGGGSKKGRGKGKGKGKGKFLKYSASAVVIMCIVLFGGIALMLSVPTFMIATIDYNLQDLGFTKAKYALKAQAENTTVAMLKEGEFPEKYAADLAEAGIDVGQVTASGDFVRTNVYIADLDNAEVAGEGGYQLHGTGKGSLAVMYDGEIILADDFVLAVESDPKLYAEYSEATDITARFYYSDEVNKVYDEMGISRGSFNDWTPTGNVQEDQQQFNDKLADILEDDSDLEVSGYDSDDNSADSVTIKTGDDASEKVSEVAEKTKDENKNVATTKAAQLLNAAISSNEPYKAAKAFIAVEEPIQRARIGDNGPVNEMMNLLSTETELTYTDVNTGEEVTKKKSILSTTNFAAAVSGGGYSKDEANNYSRDRILKATNTVDDDVIKDTTVSADSNSESRSVLGVKKKEEADDDVLQKASDGVGMAVTDDSFELFQSEAGGNRIVEGGAFLSSTINTNTIGEMPSDGSTVEAYYHEVKEMLAREAEAERATKSPFDISSPYTFAGSIVHSMMGSYISGRVSGSGGGNITSFVGAVADMAGNAVNGVVDGAVADGENDDYATLAGDSYTVNTVGVMGDLYGTAHGTIVTKYVKNSGEDWKKALPDDLDEDGKIKEREKDDDWGLSDYLKYGIRDVTVGVKSYEVCEAYRKEHGNILTSIFDTIEKWFGMYESCNSDDLSNGEDENGELLSIGGVPSDIANGQRGTLTEANSEYRELMEEISGYMLYDTVYSLLSEKKSSVSEFRDAYYAKNPKDNSRAGIVARRSGMSKAEAQIALDYAERLAVIANYDPSTRYVFGGPVFQEEEEDVLLQHSDEVQVSLYCIWSGKTEYADVRNRSFAA